MLEWRTREGCSVKSLLANLMVLLRLTVSESDRKNNHQKDGPRYVTSERRRGGRGGGVAVGKGSGDQTNERDETAIQYRYEQDIETRSEGGQGRSTSTR